MRILVTGAKGFVGKYLVAELLSNGHQVREIDSVECDIRIPEKVAQCIADFQPAAIYHLAALAYVPKCEQYFDEALAVNVLGTYNILKAAKSLPTPPRIIFISTANVYGIVSPSELPITETSEQRPDNNYAVSKLMAEVLVQKYERETKRACVIFRAFNHIGPHQSPSYVIPSFAKQLVEIRSGSQAATLKVGNLAAERDFTDVRDIVSAYSLALEAGQGTYNLCSGKAVSIRQILDRLIEIVGIKVVVEIDPQLYRNNDLPVLLGDNTRAVRDLGWKPKIELTQSLKDIVVEWESALLITV